MNGNNAYPPGLTPLTIQESYSGKYGEQLQAITNYYLSMGPTVPLIVVDPVTGNWFPIQNFDLDAPPAPNDNMDQQNAQGSWNLPLHDTDYRLIDRMVSTQFQGQRVQTHVNDGKGFPKSSSNQTERKNIVKKGLSGVKFKREKIPRKSSSEASILSQVIQTMDMIREKLDKEQAEMEADLKRRRDAVEANENPLMTAFADSFKSGDKRAQDRALTDLLVDKKLNPKKYEQEFKGYAKHSEGVSRKFARKMEKIERKIRQMQDAEQNHDME